MNHRFRRDLTFNTISTLSLGIVSLSSVPLILNNLTLSEWVNVATCQAIGAIASVLVSLGWNLTGSERISRTHQSLIHIEYLRSIIWQVSMLSILSCIAYIIIKQTYFGSSSLYLLSFLSTAMVGLRTNWLYIGLGASNELFKRETVPRVTLNIIGCIVLVEAGSVRLFFLFQILGLLLPLLLTYIWSRRNSKIKSSTGHMTKDSLLKDLQIAIPQLLYTLASFFPLFIVQRESAVNAAILALLLRLRIQFFTFVSPVSDSLISKKLSTGEKFSREWSAKKLLDLFSLIFFTIISFPIFVLFMGVFIEDSDLKFSLWQIIFFTFYISFNIVLLFVNSTQNLQNSNKREVTISIAGLSINSFGVFFGHYAFQLTGAISMMMLSQIVMLVLKLKLRENKLR